MPIGTPFHPRTFPLCTSLSYREWSGYYTVSSYEPHHEHEYSAIRNAAALIDVSPLYKYLVSGRDATRLVDRVVTRDARALAVGQVIYTPWCDEQGKVLDDGTVSRLGENSYRWTAAEPNLRWLHRNAVGLEVTIEDVSERVAALALQGPMSARLLRQVVEAAIDDLKYFRVTSGRLGGVPVEVSRTGYTGDLGYEIWLPAERAVEVWDALWAAGQGFDLHAAGMLALDVARIEAGLLLIDVDFRSSRQALIDAHRYTPDELGLGRLVALDKGAFVGHRALAAERRRGPARQVVGLEVDWPSVEAVYERVGLPPAISPQASRVPVPVRRGGLQIGRATSTTWSPTLKKLIALAQVTAPAVNARPGTELELELTVDATRYFVPATVRATPFFNPARKTRTPPG
jgi:aminomethyltransferase